MHRLLKLVLGLLHALLRYLAWSLVITIALPFVLGPPWIRHTLEMGVPSVQRLDAEQVPAAARKTLARFDEGAAQLGLQRLAWLKIGGPGMGKGGHGLALADPERGDLGLIYQPEASGERAAPAPLPHIILMRSHPDGARATTTNRDTPGIFARPAHAHAAALPATQDLERLLAFHRSWVPGLALGTPRALPRPEELPARVRDEERRQLDEQVAFGRLFRDDAGIYRPTWKGALLMTWTEAWELTRRQLRAWQQRLSATAPDGAPDRPPRVD